MELQIEDKKQTWEEEKEELIKQKEALSEKCKDIQDQIKEKKAKKEADAKE